MTGQPADSDASPEREERGATARPATPRWVKVLGAIAAVILVIVAITLLAAGEHGPGRHTSSGDTATSTPAGGTQHRPRQHP